MNKGTKVVLALILIALLLGGIVAIATPGGQRFWEEVKTHLP